MSADEIVTDSAGASYRVTPNGWAPLDAATVAKLDAITRPMEVLDLSIIQTTAASDIEPEAIEWADKDRVAYGQLHGLVGMPGVGKSTIAYDYAAKVTRAGGVVIIANAEDHPAAVTRPRLEAAGADLTKVHIVSETITLPTDVERMQTTVERLGATLVIVDPFTAYMDDGVNSHKDHDVRRVLKPLSEMAAETGAAVIVVVHTNKGQDSDPLLRVSGSIGLVAAMRLVLLAAKDPDDPERCVLACVKSNLGVLAPALAYRLVQQAVTGGVETSRVEWLEEMPELAVGRLLARGEADGGALTEALAFLRDSGVVNRAKPAQDLIREAEDYGITKRTLQRARGSMGIPAWKDGIRGGWWWGPRPEGANVVDLPTLGALASSRPPAETDPLPPEGAKSPNPGALAPSEVEALANVLALFPSARVVTE